MKGELIAVIKMASESQWKEFWEEQRQRLQSQLTATTDADLPKLKAKVTAINELEGIFIEARKK